MNSAAIIRPTGACRPTFVAELQDAAEAAVDERSAATGKPALQAALVAIDPATGNILALVGGRDYQRSAFNRASRSRRQPGSAFKPFVFAAALERGMSPVSMLTGLNQIAPQGPDEWTPRNVRRRCAGRADAAGGADRIEQSRRDPAAAAGRHRGRVLRVASRAGLDDLPDVPSLALGSGLVTPLAITAAFAVFPNGGLAVRPRDITRVRDADGGTAFEQRVETERVHLAGSRVSDGVDAARRDRSRHRIARRGGSASAFPLGGKTGTTNEFKDAWFVGFSSSVVVGVWVGFDQPQHDRRRGLRLAVRAADLGGLHAAGGAHPARRRRSSARRAWTKRRYARISYRKPVDGCPLYTEFFKEGDQIPERLCTMHRGSIRQRLTRTVARLDRRSRPPHPRHLQVTTGLLAYEHASVAQLDRAPAF